MAKSRDYVKEYYSKSEVIKLGFSDKLIDKLLPEPILKTNPKFKSAAPMKLWLISDVEKAMESEEFAEYQEKAKNRREGAKKAVATKAAKLHEAIDIEISKIRVSNMSMKNLRHNTLSEKYDAIDLTDVDESTIQRWEVNYIRHNLTQYDHSLYKMSGKVGCHDEYIRYKEAVLKKIGEAYPSLKCECNNQINKLKSADE